MPSGACRYYVPYLLTSTLHLRFSAGNETLGRQVLRDMCDHATKEYNIEGRQYKFWAT